MERTPDATQNEQNKRALQITHSRSPPALLERPRAQLCPWSPCFNNLTGVPLNPEKVNSTKADGVYGIGEEIYIDVYLSTPVVS